MKNWQLLARVIILSVLTGCSSSGVIEQDDWAEEGITEERASNPYVAPMPTYSYTDPSCCDPCPTECGPCWYLCEGYEPSYRTVAKCVEDKIPYKRQCCRYVDKFYEVPRCRFVPEYYTETVCKTELEYFEVEDCRTEKRWVYDQECTLVPKCYWKNAAECAPSCP